MNKPSSLARGVLLCSETMCIVITVSSVGIDVALVHLVS